MDSKYPSKFFIINYVIMYMKQITTLKFIAYENFSIVNITVSTRISLVSGVW